MAFPVQKCHVVQALRTARIKSEPCQVCHVMSRHVRQWYSQPLRMPSPILVVSSGAGGSSANSGLHRGLLASQLASVHEPPGVVVPGLLCCDGSHLCPCGTRLTTLPRSCDGSLICSVQVLGICCGDAGESRCAVCQGGCKEIAN